MTSTQASPSMYETMLLTQPLDEAKENNMTESTGLVQYDSMRQALERCARIDEVKDIHDKARALELYAQQTKDKQMEVWVAEIKQRANIRTGELVRDLEKMPREQNSPYNRRSGTRPSITKAQAIKDAGVSKTTSWECENLAGPADEDTAAAVLQATEECFAEARATSTPIKRITLLKARHKARGTTSHLLKDKTSRSRQHPITKHQPSNGGIGAAASKRDISLRRLFEAIDRLPMGELVTEQMVTKSCGDMPTFRMRCATLPWLAIETVPGGWIFQIDTELREICEGRRPRPSLNGVSMKARFEKLREDFNDRSEEVYGRKTKRNWNMEAIIKKELIDLLNWIKEEINQIITD